MKKTYCDKCGKEIGQDARHVVGCSSEEPNEKGECKPKDWIFVKEICKECYKEIERMFIH